MTYVYLNVSEVVGFQTMHIFDLHTYLAAFGPAFIMYFARAFSGLARQF